MAHDLSFVHHLLPFQIIIQSVFSFLIDSKSIKELQTNIYRNCLRKLNTLYRSEVTSCSLHISNQLFDEEERRRIYPLIVIQVPLFYEKKSNWLLWNNRNLLPHQKTDLSDRKKNMTTNTRNYKHRNIQTPIYWWSGSSLSLWDHDRLKCWVKKYAMYDHMQKTQQLCSKHNMNIKLVLSSFEAACAKNNRTRNIWFHGNTPIKRSKNVKYQYYLYADKHRKNHAMHLLKTLEFHKRVLKEVKFNCRHCDFPQCEQFFAQPAYCNHKLCAHHRKSHGKIFSSILRPSTNDLLKQEHAACFCHLT